MCEISFMNINNNGHEVVNQVLQPKAGKHVVRDKGFPTHVAHFSIMLCKICFPDVKVKFKDAALLFETMTKVYLKKIFMPKEEQVFQYIFRSQNTLSIVGSILTDIYFHVMVKTIQYSV